MESVVRSVANAWSSTMQTSGQYRCNEVVKWSAISHPAHFETGPVSHAVANMGGASYALETGDVLRLQPDSNALRRLAFQPRYEGSLSDLALHFPRRGFGRPSVMAGSSHGSMLKVISTA